MERDEQQAAFSEQSMLEEQHEQERIESKAFRLAGFWVRFWAYILDLITISAITFLLVNPLLRLLNISEGAPSWLQSNFATIGLIGILYFIVMTKIWSQTLGKMIMGIKVIRKDNKPLDWLTVIFREGIGRNISQLLGVYLGYIWAAFHSRKQTWHDQIGDTFVVYEEDVVAKQIVHIQVKH